MPKELTPEQWENVKNEAIHSFLEHVLQEADINPDDDTALENLEVPVM